MHIRRKALVVVAIIATLILITSRFQALAQDLELGEKATGADMVVDFILLRPLGIVATAVGTVIFIGSLPFSVPTGNTKVSFENLIEEPAKFTFARPLGELEGGILGY